METEIENGLLLSEYDNIPIAEVIEKKHYIREFCNNTPNYKNFKYSMTICISVTIFTVFIIGLVYLFTLY